MSHNRMLSAIGIFPSLFEERQQEIKDIPVFYNVYVSNQSEHERVHRLVMDQLSYLQPFHHPVYVHTIGYPLSIPNTTLLQHHANASELVTLHTLWEYCQTHPDEKVVYLHSKGSYHPSEENDLMRQLLTMAALSKECAVNTDNIKSSVCAYRFAPYPHPHVPGNMWLAHCSHVNNLLEPYQFGNDMNAVEARLVWKRDIHGSCVGNGRFAAEHWIYSHPGGKPSDMYNNPNFSWGYDGLRAYQEGDFEWKAAPRFRVDYWPIGCDYSDLTHRLKEYRLLYNMTPGRDWWGWDFWLGPTDRPHWPKQHRWRQQKNERQDREQRLKKQKEVQEEMKKKQQEAQEEKKKKQKEAEIDNRSNPSVRIEPLVTERSRLMD